MKNQSIFPVLTTEQLVLRQLTLDDTTEIAALRSDDRVNKYLDRPAATTLNEAAEFIRKIDAAIGKTSFYWVISLKNDPKLIGTICLWNINHEESSIEIGYELHPDYQRRGLMQEAIKAVISYTFETLKLKIITAFPDGDNQPSIILLERNNFKPEPNPEKGTWPDVIYYLQNHQ